MKFEAILLPMTGIYTIGFKYSAQRLARYLISRDVHRYREYESHQIKIAVEIKTSFVART